LGYGWMIVPSLHGTFYLRIRYNVNSQLVKSQSKQIPRVD